MTREQMQLLELEMVSQPVRSLQYMLRRVSQRHGRIPELQPDGRFGERTLEAVLRFQKQMGLPITGVVDQDTWHTLREEWLDVERELAHPRQLRAFPAGEQTGVGESKEYLFVVQAMFQALSRVLDEIQEEQIDGIHNGTSVDNVRWLQNRAHLEETGTLNRETWDALAQLYELFVVREPQEREAIIHALGRG